MSDPYDPHTQLGQTSWGTLIRGERERAQQREAQTKQISESITRMQRANAEYRPVNSPRVLMPQEAAELDRRARNRNFINKSAPFFKRLTGHVVSYLDEDSRLITNANNDFAEGQVVLLSEHLNRLQRAYKDLWLHILRTNELNQNANENAAGLCEDARDRLSALESRRLICPVNRSVSKAMCSLYEQKKTLFSTKKVKKKVWRVRLDQYDRRFRLFAGKVYLSHHQFSKLLWNGAPLCSLPARDTFYFFLNLPSSAGFES